MSGTGQIDTAFRKYLECNFDALALYAADHLGNSHRENKLKRGPCTYCGEFFPLSVVYWNRLPAEVVMLPTLDQFSVVSGPPPAIVQQHSCF